MQNIDFYNGKDKKNPSPRYNSHDPEYFTRTANIQRKEEEKNRKKASRMFSLIISLCIISFTIGLIIGIKLSAGSKKEIIDSQTRSAVNNIGKTVKDMLKKGSESKQIVKSNFKSHLFPKNDFPYVIRVGRDLGKSRSQEIANFLSIRGHTVIISKNNKKYNIYTGPYRNEKEVHKSSNMIKDYSQELFSESMIVKR